MWLVYCVCYVVSAVKGDGRVVEMGRWARGRCRFVCMCLAAMLGVWGGVFSFAVITLDWMSVREVRCVASGVESDEVELCGGMPVTLSYSSVRNAPAPTDKITGEPVLCSVPWLIPCMCGCEYLVFF